MYLKRIFVMLSVAACVTAMAARINAQTNVTDAPLSPQTSEAASALVSPLGTWEVTATFPDGFKTKGLITFAPGADSNTGSVLSTADIDFTFPVPCANQQGVWARPGGGTHVDLTYKGFCYNSSFEPFGTLKIQQSITLGTRGNGFTGRAHVELKRFDGSTEFTADATLRAVRMAVEPLP
jgi:hypothetical protein